MLKLLHNQNVGLKTDGWRVYSKVRGNGGMRFTFGVDRGTIEWVKTHKMMLYYGTDKVKCTLPQKKMASKLSASGATVEAPTAKATAEKPRTDGLERQIVERQAQVTQTSGQSVQTSEADSICINMATSCHINGGAHSSVQATNPNTDNGVRDGD